MRPAGSADEVGAPHGPPMEDGRCLVVDDDPETLEALGTFLRTQLPDVEVLCLLDPLEAAKRLRSERVDVLIADLNMPRMTGAELVRAGRAARPGIATI